MCAYVYAIAVNVPNSRAHSNPLTVAILARDLSMYVCARGSHTGGFKGLTDFLNLVEPMQATSKEIHDFCETPFFYTSTRMCRCIKRMYQDVCMYVHEALGMSICNVSAVLFIHSEEHVNAHVRIRMQIQAECVHILPNICGKICTQHSGVYVRIYMCMCVYGY